MRKFLYTLILSMLALVVIPSCTNTDSLDEVVEESDLDISAGTKDGNSNVAKPTK